MSKEVTKQTGSFKSFDGTSIYFEERGAGKVIVFAYGLACTMNHWTHQIQHFSQNYRVITLDYRGHHRSDTPIDRNALSIPAISRDIVELCQFLGVPSAAFCGHSFGVQVLLKLYDLAPDLIKSLVFVNGFASNPIQHVLRSDLWAPTLNAIRLSQEHFPKQTQKLWQMLVGNPLLIPMSAVTGGFNLSLTSLKDIEVYARGVAAMDLRTFTTLFDEMVKFDGSPILSQIRVPSLIISGGRDGVTPPAYQRQMHEQIFASKLKVLKEGSHCTQLDLPNEVNRAIQLFFNECDHKPRRAQKDATSSAADKA